MQNRDVFSVFRLIACKILQEVNVRQLMTYNKRYYSRVGLFDWNHITQKRLNIPRRT